MSITCPTCRRPYELNDPIYPYCVIKYSTKLPPVIYLEILKLIIYSVYYSLGEQQVNDDIRYALFFAPEVFLFAFLIYDFVQQNISGELLELHMKLIICANVINYYVVLITFFKVNFDIPPDINDEVIPEPTGYIIFAYYVHHSVTVNAIQLCLLFVGYMSIAAYSEYFTLVKYSNIDPLRTVKITADTFELQTN